mmetsp:Transcript_21666/g.33673  ORF Transcript_21666/g.33673 Transcript_21666/m.33673 type:complete len:327 (+) Transcript_21666:334-1314(+)
MGDSVKGKLNVGVKPFAVEEFLEGIRVEEGGKLANGFFTSKLHVPSRIGKMKEHSREDGVHLLFEQLRGGPYPKPTESAKKTEGRSSNLAALLLKMRTDTMDNVDKDRLYSFTIDNTENSIETVHGLHTDIFITVINDRHQCVDDTGGKLVGHFLSTCCGVSKTNDGLKAEIVIVHRNEKSIDNVLEDLCILCPVHHLCKGRGHHQSLSFKVTLCVGQNEVVQGQNSVRESLTKLSHQHHHPLRIGHIRLDGHLIFEDLLHLAVINLLHERIKGVHKVFTGLVGVHLRCGAETQNKSSKERRKPLLQDDLRTQQIKHTLQSTSSTL